MRVLPVLTAIGFTLGASPGVALASTGPAWDTWPTGRTFVTGPARPVSLRHRVCSFAWPVCVHGDAPGDVLASVATAEEAMAALSARSLLPLPIPDDGGGSGAFDIYLAPTGDRPLRVGFAPPLGGPHDRAAVFALVDRGLKEGCGRRAAIHRATAVAMLAAIDSGAEAGAFASTSAFLAGQMSGCAPLDAIDFHQRNPELPSMGASDPDDPAASPLLPFYLDTSFGAGAPGTFLTALWYSGQQRTPANATRYVNQPDFVEVFRRLAKSRQTTEGDLLLEFAIARAFFGDRDDGQHVSGTSSWGPLGRPRFDAAWEFAALPRRVAFTPLEPMGSTFVWLGLDGAGEHPAVGFRAEWESPVTMRWGLVRIGKAGEEMSRINVTVEKGIRGVERTILELDGALGVLVVGVNVGEVDITHPFKADEAPYEPHGGTVYLVANP